MKNSGKKFEECWKKSCPDYVFYYRFRDNSGSWGGNSQIRFTPSNIADCLLYDPNTGLHLIELKNHKGKSIPLTCIVSNKTKEKQIRDLFDATKFSNVYSHIVVFFSDIERCFDLPINKFMFFKNTEERKSIPLSYFEQNGKEIDVIKLRTNYCYNIEKWLKG